MDKVFLTVFVGAFVLSVTTATAEGRKKAIEPLLAKAREASGTEGLSRRLDMAMFGLRLGDDP